MATGPGDWNSDDWMNGFSQLIDPSTIAQNQTAIDQRHKAADLEKGLVRPWYDVPESEKEALDSARAQSKMTRLPGQSAIEGRLDSTTANEISLLERAGMGGTDLINGASRAYGNQQLAENKLGTEAASMYLHNQDVFRNELHNNADYQDKAWDWNYRLPYDQKYNQVQALKGASIQNTNSAWNSSVGGIKDFFENFYSMGAAKSNSKENKTDSGISSNGNGKNYYDQGDGSDFGNTNSSQYPVPDQKSVFDSGNIVPFYQ